MDMGKAKERSENMHIYEILPIISKKCSKIYTEFMVLLET